MKNVTLAMDEKLVQDGRRYAREHQTSLNKLLRDLLARTVREDRHDWTDECLTKMDAARGHSRGRTWTRQDLHDG